MISHHFIELNELIFKMYSLGFEIIFHEIYYKIEENWKNFESK
jgi:hypothetical protein